MHTHTTKNSRSDYFLLLLCLQTVSLHNTLLFLLFDYYFFWRFVVSSFFVLELTTRRLVFVCSAFINNELYRGWCRGWMDCCRVKADQHTRTSTGTSEEMNEHTHTSLFPLEEHPHTTLSGVMDEMMWHTLCLLKCSWLHSDMIYTCMHSPCEKNSEEQI